MQKTTLISVVAVGLLVSNLALVAHVLRSNNRPPHPPHPSHQPGGPKNLIIERLHFDEQQVAAYQQLIDQHRAAIRAGDKRILQLKTELYTSLSAPADNVPTDSLAVAIANEQRHMEQVHYHHFADIKKLCRPDQLKYFNELAPELAQLFGPPPHRPR